MKKQISPTVAIVLIVVVLVIIVAVGWFAFLKPDSGSGDPIDINALDQATMNSGPGAQGQAPPPVGGEGSVAQ